MHILLELLFWDSCSDLKTRMSNSETELLNSKSKINELEKQNAGV